ncbi:MAG TPA: alpha/beta fold hydrolase [Gemmatimonadaceae bacterium]|nr:alpha/beta fold hydrolase [Gemmatimonadaceae bacterium]
MVINASVPPAFAPAWWVPGPHAQTLWGKFARRIPLPAAGYFERWDTPDGDFLDLFRIPGTDAAPRLLILHGLEGTVQSHYARGILSWAAGRGWAADLLLFRGCGSEPNRAPRFYHSGETADLSFVVSRLTADRSSGPLFLVGYSLGGNVLLKWLGERGGALPAAVRAAAAVSVPYDLEAGAAFIHHGFSQIYERHFLRTLKAKAARKLDQFPGLFDPAALAAARSIVAFDEAVTAPVHGFASARDYYQRSSSIRFLPDIRVPTLLLSAYDDPFLPPDRLAATAGVARGNAALDVCFSPHGGHVGFVSGAVPAVPVYFSELRIDAFFTSHLESGGPRHYDDA